MESEKKDRQYFIKRWSDPDLRPKLKRSLVDENGCMCVQGDVLYQCGYSYHELRSLNQKVADIKTAEILEISVPHSIFLRTINDTDCGCPQDVIDPDGIERILGPNAKLVLAFWRFLEKMSDTELRDVLNREQLKDFTCDWESAQKKTEKTVKSKKIDHAAINARFATCGYIVYSTKTGLYTGGGAATHELIVLEEISPLYFLPIFGITNPRAQLAPYMVD